MRIRRPSPSLVVAGIAIVFASTGSAVAARKITSDQIRDRTIKLQDISRRARVQLAGQQGPAGPVGPQGAKGEQGPPGDAGLAKLSYVEGPLLEMFDRAHPEIDEFGVYALCPEGQAPTAGGVDAYTAEVDADGNPVSGTEAGDPNLIITLDVPIDDRPGSPGDDKPSGWGVNIYNDGPMPALGRGDFAFAWAVCAPAAAEFAGRSGGGQAEARGGAARGRDSTPGKAPAPFHRGAAR